MKKFFAMAALAMMAMTASAQNPDALKQIKGAKGYSEANEIMKTQGESMTAQERAQAYNKLVDFAIADFNKADEKVVKAQIAKDEAEEAKQNGKKLKSAYNALKAARECDKADREPNDKGQVKPKFRKANQSRVIPSRNALINGGLEAYNSKDYATAQKYFGAFVDSRKDELFTGYDFSAETNYGDLAYYAGLAAYFNNDFKKCSKFSDIALENNYSADDAITLKLGALEGQVKNAEIDTTKMISSVKKIYKQFPENQTAFGKLIALYQEAGDNVAADKVLADRLKSNPNDAMALAYMGQNKQNASDWDGAIEAYVKAVDAKPDFVAAKFNLGVCHLNRATGTYDAKADNRGVVAPEVKEQILKDLNTAKSVFESLKDIDPDQNEVRWQYQLDRVNYAIETINQ